MESKTVKPSDPVFNKDYNLGIELTKDQVDISEIEEEARKEGFREQTFRHITLLSEKTFVPLYSKFSETEQSGVIQKINDLIKKTDWSFTPREIYFIEEYLPEGEKEFPNEFRESYVRVVDLPGAREFIDGLNKILSSDIPYIFTHITLFSKGEAKGRPYFGIPIPSEEAFKKLKTKRVS